MEKCQEPNCRHVKAPITGKPRCWWHWAQYLNFAITIHGPLADYKGESPALAMVRKANP